MLVRLHGPNDHVSFVRKIVDKRLALADEFFSSCRSLNVVGQLVLSLVDFVATERCFVPVMNELVRERGLRVHELNGGVTFPRIDQQSRRLWCFRGLSVWALGFDAHKVPVSNYAGLLRLGLCLRQPNAGTAQDRRNGLPSEPFILTTSGG
jgi:hypothetical protein